MLVTRPMMPTSACATNPIASASAPTTHKCGGRARRSATVPAERAPFRSLLPGRLPSPGRFDFLKHHWRRPSSLAELFDDVAEDIGEAAALARLHALERLDDFFLSNRRRLMGGRRSALGDR